ncbi:MAG: hypothetical protein MJ108_09270 [Saccharofermentans sp.]|nr:hypothetical protein [Saccharofermentans sp.]
MINTNGIYEKIMMDVCLKRIMNERNRWDDYNSRTESGNSYFEYEGYDYIKLSSIMTECKCIIEEMLNSLVYELLKAYRISFKYYRVQKGQAKVHVISNKDFHNRTTDLSEGLSFTLEKEQHKNVYFFSQYGLSNRLSLDATKELLKVTGAEKVRYVSLVESGAYKAILNHNDCLSDETRGTDTYSLKQFFMMFFDSNEYEKFSEYNSKFNKLIKEYLGFKVVRSINSKSFTIKTSILDAFACTVNERKKALSQGDILSCNFYKNNKHKLIVGDSEFSKCFITAEWMYRSLFNTQNIDYTAIAMGYYKSIEIFLLEYIKVQSQFHDCKLWVSNKFINVRELEENSDLIAKINLGNLINFFGYYDKLNNEVKLRNPKFIETNITKHTHEELVKCLFEIHGLRNNYFHKEILIDWNIVEESRKIAYNTFFLLFGSCVFNEKQLKLLGLIDSKEKTNFDALCEYVYQNPQSVLTEHGMKIKIYYLQTKEIGDCWMLFPDMNMEYDFYGTPVYSGVFFQRPTEQKGVQNRVKISADNCPLYIYEGTLTISMNGGSLFDVSGPQQKIYEDGKFLIK